MSIKKLLVPLILAVIALSYVNCDGEFKPITSEVFNSDIGDNPNPGGDPNPIPQPPVIIPLKYYLYVASQGLNIIDTYAINSTDGRLSKVSSVAALGSPMPLAIHPNKKVFYAGSSSRDSVLSYSINPTSGALTALKEVVVAVNPVYIHVDLPAKNLFIPSYGDSAVAVLPLNADGTLGDAVSDTKMTGPNSHAAITMAAGNYAFVTNTVGNSISQFLFNPATGVLTPNPQEPTISGGAGDGPRHIVAHPKKDNILYAVNEVGDSVTMYSLDKTTGRLTQFQNIRTLPNGINGNNNTCADIHITADGKFLYASNRGHNSIAIFNVDANTGMLAVGGHQLVQGTPREFEVDPTGKYLFVGGLTADKLSSFAIDQTNGLLTPIEVLDFNSPIWLMSVGL